MRVKFAITQDDGTPVMDATTGQAHAFDFPMAPEVMAIVTGWMDKINASQETPKYPHLGEVAREVLFNAFQAMIPPEALAQFDAQIAAIQAQKQALLWGFFGQTPQ